MRSSLDFQPTEVYIFFFLFLIFRYFRRVFRARARPLEHYSRKKRALSVPPDSSFSPRLLDNRRTPLKNHSAVPSRHDPLETSLVGSLFEATADRLSKVVAFSKLEVRLDQDFSLRVFRDGSFSLFFSLVWTKFCE